MFSINGYGRIYRRLSAPVFLSPKKFMFSHPRIASCFHFARAELQPVGTILGFCSRAPKKLPDHRENAICCFAAAGSRTARNLRFLTPARHLDTCLKRKSGAVGIAIGIERISSRR